jgi:hypothetical protein
MIMTNTKMTKRVAFNAIKEILVAQNETELVSVIDHEIELLDHKNAIRAKAQTKVQKENEILKEKILATMEPNVQYRASELYNLMKEDFQDKGYTSNKTNSLISQLKNENKVTRSVEKGIAYFTKVTE